MKNYKIKESFFNYQGQLNKNNIINALTQQKNNNLPLSTFLKVDNMFPEQEDNENKKMKIRIKKNDDPKDDVYYNSIPERSCKYIPSLSSNPSCPAGYESYSGASIGIKDGQLSCNGNIIGNESAEAMPVMEENSISKIYITNPGNNYQKVPKITIIGDGKLASAEAEIEEGQVVNIKVTNPGRDYKRPPKIMFSKPDSFVFCHLCCKK